MKSKITLVTVVVLLMTTLSGCIGVNRSFRELRNYLTESLDERLDREIEFSIGPVALMFAGIFANFSDTEEKASEMMSKISRVQVSIFNRLEAKELEFGLFREITRKMAKYQMRYILRVKEGDTMTAVFVNGNSDNIGKMFVVVIEKEQLVLVEILGDLDKLVEIALREQGFNMEYAVRE